MAVTMADINNARRVAGHFRSLASNVEDAWGKAPKVPGLWVGAARESHKKDIDKVDKLVGTAQSNFRSAADRLESHANALVRQWNWEQQNPESPFRPFGPFGLG